MKSIPSLCVALTGGIASGKSVVANEFARLGAPVIDTDILAREVVEPGQPALAQLVAHFGPDILDGSQRLDRTRMRERVFQDAEARRYLESVLHPAIRARQEQLALQRADAPYQIHVVPLLVETGTAHRFDRVLVVDCPREIQRERLIRRDGSTAELAERILDAQTDRAQRLAIADDVIDNQQDLNMLMTQVQTLHERYLQLSQTKRSTQHRT